MAQATVRAYTTRRFTVEEYHKLAEVGILSEDDRVELIEGEIIVNSPIGSKHAACVNRLTHLFSQRVGGRAIVSVQNPIRLGEHSEPQPDLALLKPRPDFYAEEHPKPEDVLLVVEVAETSSEYDRHVKIPLYARHGIPEVWLIDLSKGRLTAFRKPQRGVYARIEEAKKGDRIAPEALPDVVIPLEELLI